MKKSFFLEDNLKNIALRLKEGDPRAFRELYDIFKDRLYYFTLRFSKSPYLAEEIVQEVFIKVWENRDRLNEDFSLKSYIYTISKNSIINFLRKVVKEEKLKQEILAFSDIEYLLFEDGGVQDIDRLIHTAIGLLPTRRKEVFTLAKFKGYSYDQISVELGISKNTVRLQIIEANKFIKSYIENSSPKVY